MAERAGGYLVLSKRTRNHSNKIEINKMNKPSVANMGSKSFTRQAVTFSSALRFEDYAGVGPTV